MDIGLRMRIIRLMDKIEKNPKIARDLKLKAITKKKKKV